MIDTQKSTADLQETVAENATTQAETVDTATNGQELPENTSEQEGKDETLAATPNITDQEQTINEKLGNQEEFVDLSASVDEAWERCEREDLKHMRAMAAHGWAVEFTATDIRHSRTTPSNPPHESVTFTKGDKLARTHIQFGTGEQVWNVIDARGINEARKYEDLLDVLEAE